MNGLTPVLREIRLWINTLRLAYYRWARREIHPLHPDLPAIVHRIRRLELERSAL